MKKIFLSLIVFCNTTIFAQSNINLSNAQLFNGEPYLAINPTNNQNIVASWMSMTFASGQFVIGIKTNTSFDGGNNWSASNTLPHFGTGFGSADVSMVFDKNGTLFLSYIDYKQSPDSGGIYVTRSYNGGVNFDAPIKAFDMYDVVAKRPMDRPWLVIDQSNTANAGTLYITTKPAPWIPAPNRNYFKASTDSGKTWTPIANVDGGTHLVGNLISAPMASPACTKNGKFCAVYPSYVISQNSLPAFYFAYSYNKGQTFNYSTIYANTVTPIDANLKAGYRLIANPKDSNLLIAFFINGANGDADILASNTNDGGQTWSALKRVNDDAIANGKDQDMVWASYSAQGNLAITWRDRRDATANGFWNAGYDFYYSTSADNGTTFSTNKKLSSQFIPFDSVIAQSGNDMMSSTYNNDTLYATWGDTRDGKMNIYFSKTIASTNTNVGITTLQGDEIKLNVYPNPANHYLQLNVNTDLIKKEAFIFDAHGKKIKSFFIHTTNQKIDIASMQKGIYFLSVNGLMSRFVKE
jgi:Secretion system C-terminal sorting domain